MNLIALVAALAISGSAFADNYKIDPSHTSIVFKIAHLEFSHVYGFIPGTEGKFTIDEKQPDKSSLEFTLKMDQITTHDKKRDEHLHSPDFRSLDLGTSQRQRWMMLPRCVYCHLRRRAPSLHSSLGALVKC